MPFYFKMNAYSDGGEGSGTRISQPLQLSIYFYPESLLYKQPEYQKTRETPTQFESHFCFIYEAH